MCGCMHGMVIIGHRSSKSTVTDAPKHQSCSFLTLFKEGGGAGGSGQTHVNKLHNS